MQPDIKLERNQTGWPVCTAFRYQDTQNCLPDANKGTRYCLPDTNKATRYFLPDTNQEPDIATQCAQSLELRRHVGSRECTGTGSTPYDIYDNESDRTVPEAPAVG